MFANENSRPRSSSTAPGGTRRRGSGLSGRPSVGVIGEDTEEAGHVTPLAVEVLAGEGVPLALHLGESFAEL